MNKIEKYFLRKFKDRNEYLLKKYMVINKFFRKKFNTTDVVILRLDLIGDCTMFTSVLPELKKIYSGRSMTMVCLECSKLIFERVGIFDRVIGIKFKPDSINYEELEQVIKELRTQCYDILLSPQLSKYPLADILAAAIRCNTRIEMETRPGNSRAEWIALAASLYDVKIPYPREGQISEFKYYAEFIRGLGNKEYKVGRPSLPSRPQKFVKGNYYVLYPNGSFQIRNWSPERYAKVAEFIYHETGYVGVILGTAKERNTSERIKENLNLQTYACIVDLTGKTSLDDVIDIIGGAKFIVSNDTSGVHIACATNTPSVAIAGGWHFDRFLPYHLEYIKESDNLPMVVYTQMPCYFCDLDPDKMDVLNPHCRKSIAEGHFECIENVSVNQVCEQVSLLINKHGFAN